MDVSGCVKAAESALRSYRHFLCDFCGTETLSGGPFAFCSNCESIVTSSARALERDNPHLFSELVGIRHAMERENFEAAAMGYDRLLELRPSTQLMYAKGLMYLEYSNHAVAQIHYGKEVHIERNEELRRVGSLLMAQAKEFIERALAILEEETAMAASASLFYRILLCDLKLNDLRAAGTHLKKIIEFDREREVAPYSRVILSCSAGLYLEAQKEIELMISSQAPHANIFYYAAFNTFKLGDLKGAERILERSGALIEESKRETLLRAIKRREGR